MDKILLVDGHSILNRAFYGLPDLTNSRGEHTNAVLGFINMILKVIEEEKPKILYLPKLPKNSQGGYNKKINYSVGIWKKGLVRERLRQKCMEHSVEIKEVFGRAISATCSNCGATGKYDGAGFRCGSCGYESDKKTNAARNALKRGQDEETE